LPLAQVALALERHQEGAAQRPFLIWCHTFVGFVVAHLAIAGSHRFFIGGIPPPGNSAGNSAAARLAGTN
jgi:hypothetical protein